MGFTQPDLSELLSNEQQLNRNLISIQSILKTKLSSLNVPYTDSESIKVMVSKTNPNYYWQINKNSTTSLFDEIIIISNSQSSLTTWNKIGNDYYLQALTNTSGSNPALVLGLFNDDAGEVKGSVNFDIKFFLSNLNFINRGFAGVGLTIGTPNDNSSFTGIFYGAYQNSSGEVYPAVMKFKNTSQPTITIPDYSSQMQDDSFQIYLINNYNPNYGYITCEWLDGDGNRLGSNYVSYTEFCQTFTDMNNTIRFATCSGAESIGRMQYIPRVKMTIASRIKI